MNSLGYIYGWKEIAEYLGRSVRWCEYAAAAPEHPLPIRRDKGRIIAAESEIRAWWERRIRILRS